MNQDKQFLLMAINLASSHSKKGDCGPFGAVITKQGRVVAEGWNQVVSTLDPSAHAEVVAIRLACQKLGTHELKGCTLYSSCEPCPMCFSAAVWSRLDRIVYAETRQGAAKAGFDDELIYHLIDNRTHQSVIQYQQIYLEQATRVFDAWLSNPLRKNY